MANIFEILAFSIMIGLFIIGYMRGGYLEGLKSASYSIFLTTVIGFLIYILTNEKHIKQLIYDPMTNEMHFEKLPTEIYGFGFLFLLSFLTAASVELYVKTKKGRKELNHVKINTYP